MLWSQLKFNHSFIHNPQQNAPHSHHSPLTICLLFHPLLSWASSISPPWAFPAHVQYAPIKGTPPKHSNSSLSNSSFHYPAWVPSAWQTPEGVLPAGLPKPGPNIAVALRWGGASAPNSPQLHHGWYWTLIRLYRKLAKSLAEIQVCNSHKQSSIQTLPRGLEQFSSFHRQRSSFHFHDWISWVLAAFQRLYASLGCQGNTELGGLWSCGRLCVGCFSF